jgi:hypothetical protein
MADILYLKPLRIVSLCIQIQYFIVQQEALKQYFLCDSLLQYPSIIEGLTVTTSAKSAPLLVRAAFDVTGFLAIAAPLSCIHLFCSLNTWFSFPSQSTCIYSSVPLHVFV